MTYNSQGLKYFLYLSTINSEKYYLCLPDDIRRIIWRMAHNLPFICCHFCYRILLSVNINTLDDTISEYLTIQPGIISCQECNYFL